jgi:hypothetical protein
MTTQTAAGSGSAARLSEIKIDLRLFIVGFIEKIELGTPRQFQWKRYIEL